MPDAFYFIAFGGLGVSLAGFAGLISVLDRSAAAHSAVAAYRVRGIVFLGFTLTLVGFGTVALYTVSEGNLGLTIRLASLGLALMAVRGLFESRPGAAWPIERERRFSIGILLLITAVTLGNVAYAHLGYLELLMLLQLSGPMSIFYNTVRDSDGVESSPRESGDG